MAERGYGLQDTHMNSLVSAGCPAPKPPTVPEFLEEIQQLALGINIVASNVADALGGCQPPQEQGTQKGMENPSILAKLRTIRDTLNAAAKNTERAGSILKV